MKTFIKKNSFAIVGVLLGALAGYLYWHFIGCTSGSCAITSNPMNSTLYGAMMGGLVLSLFKPQSKKS
ncbi:MAG TPA: DUF6132 family protein [Flavobacterium sp.]|nr:DUF6132 family protein [Flavobacterium sp.]